MIPAIFIRPEPGLASSLAAARERGLDARGFALFEVRALPCDMPDPDSFDAALVGSANALRHGGAALAAYRGKPAYAVGEKTATACRNAGFEVLVVGEGGLQNVLGMIDPHHRRLLRLAGAARVDLVPPDGVTISECIVYASEARPMPEALADLLQDPAVVALHSAEAARHFLAECEEHGIDRARLHLACIGPRVAHAAGDGWADVKAADNPHDAALLALVGQMCKEVDGQQQQDAPSRRQSGKGPMQDDYGPSVNTVSQRGFAARNQLLVTALAFVLGAAAVGWMAWRGHLETLLPGDDTAASAMAEGAYPAAGSGDDEPETPDTTADLESVSTVEARLAMLEDRFSRLNLQADAASGNAARAESLLIAFAARRMIDRGEPLRYLADQLQLRFANAQPRAVRTVLSFAKSPVTVDELSARLEALAPQLTGTSAEESFWQSARRGLSDLFTVRTEPSELLSSEARLERARVMLRAGRIAESVAEVQRLANSEAAAKWIADARRYANAQRALDLIETAAMLDPSLLQDADGNQVDQRSPLATPTSAPASRKPQ